MTFKTKAAITLFATSCIVAASVRYMLALNEWNTYGFAVGQWHFETNSTAKSIGMALEMYASDNDGRLPGNYPDAAKWRQSLSDYVHNGFESHNPKGGFFVPNNKVAGCRLSADLEPKTIISFEEKEWRQGEKAYVFADGSAKFLKASDPKNFNPKQKAR